MSLTDMVIPPWVMPVLRVAFCVGLFIGGYVYRGDGTAQLRANETVATAKAEVKAEQIATKTEVKNVQRVTRRTQLTAAINALPPVPVVVPAASPEAAPACAPRELSDDERRLWNAGNQDLDGSVQPPSVDAARPGDAPRAAQ